MIREYFRIAWQSLSRRQLRSWLTMIGIFIGIAAVVSLISLSLGMQAAIVESFEAIGSDKLFISPDTSFGVVGDNTGNEPLTEDDMLFLEGIAGVEAVTSYTLTSAKVEYQGVIRYFSIIGVPEEPERMALANEVFASDAPYDGRRLRSGDRFSASMGFHHATRQLYDGKDMRVNDRFLINDKKFNTIGFAAPVGNSADDRLIIVPLDAFQEVTGVEERVDMIIVQVAAGKDPSALAEELTRSLARYRGLKTGDEDFEIQTPEDLLASFEVILNVVQVVLIGIAFISLVVGAIGITNTMYTSVLERNKEIGIMKAIGAKNENIFSLFFVESGFLGLVGGILGIIIGTGFALAVELISEQALGKTFLQAYFSWELFAGAILFSFFIGAIAGTLPAVQASKLQPVETLRDE